MREPQRSHDAQGEVGGEPEAGEQEVPPAARAVRDRLRGGTCRGRPHPELLCGLVDAVRVRLLPEGQQRGHGEAERKQPEEEAVREPAREQRASPPRRSRSNASSPRLDAAHAGDAPRQRALPEHLSRGDPLPEPRRPRLARPRLVVVGRVVGSSSVEIYRPQRRDGETRYPPPTTVLCSPLCPLPRHQSQ